MTVNNNSMKKALDRLGERVKRGSEYSVICGVVVDGGVPCYLLEEYMSIGGRVVPSGGYSYLEIDGK